MNRTFFQISCCGALVGTALQVCPSGVSARPAQKSARPNILYIMSDDHGSQTISSYGGPLFQVFRTPNIDRLAEEGMRLDHCFATNSISVPSRASIMTGCYSQCNGVYTLRDTLNSALPNMAKELQQAGYQTAIIGKWHQGTEPSGFDYYNVLPGQGRYGNPVLIEKGNLNGPDFAHAKGTVHPGHSTDVIADEALRWLKSTDRETPFFLMCHFKAPHRTWISAPRFKHLLEDVTIPEPANLYDDYSDGREHLDALTIFLEDMNKADLKVDIPKGLSRDELRKWAYQLYLKEYLRCIAGVDENVGRLLDYLDENGLTENTIVIYTSDQGFFLGEHGLFDKRLMYEESIKMPFLIRYPGVIEAGTTNDDLILNIDFAPTLLDFAGLRTPGYMQGRSFVQNLQGDTPASWRKSFYYRYWMHNDFATHVPGHYGIRTDRYKLIFNYGKGLGMAGASKEDTTPCWEFYDLAEDPMEMRNLYDDPRYAKTIESLKKEMLRLKKQYHDEDSNYPEMREVVERYW